MSLEQDFFYGAVLSSYCISLERQHLFLLIYLLIMLGLIQVYTAEEIIIIIPQLASAYLQMPIISFKQQVHPYVVDT